MLYIIIREGETRRRYQTHNLQVVQPGERIAGIAYRVDDTRCNHGGISSPFFDQKKDSLDRK